MQKSGRHVKIVLVLFRKIGIMTGTMLNITQNKEPGGLIKASHLARLLSVNSRTLHNWCEAGLIPVAYRAGRTVRFDPDAVKEALEKSTQVAMADKAGRRQESLSPDANA